MSTNKSRHCDGCGTAIANGDRFYGFFVEEETEEPHPITPGRKKRRRWTEEEDPERKILTGNFDLCGSCAERPVAFLDLVRRISDEEEREAIKSQ